MAKTDGRTDGLLPCPSARPGLVDPPTSPPTKGHGTMYPRAGFPRCVHVQIQGIGEYNGDKVALHLLLVFGSENGLETQLGGITLPTPAELHRQVGPLHFARGRGVINRPVLTRHSSRPSPALRRRSSRGSEVPPAASPSSFAIAVLSFIRVRGGLHTARPQTHRRQRLPRHENSIHPRLSSSPRPRPRRFTWC